MLLQLVMRVRRPRVLHCRAAAPSISSTAAPLAARHGETAMASPSCGAPPDEPAFHHQIGSAITGSLWPINPMDRVQQPMPGP